MIETLSRFLWGPYKENQLDVGMPFERPIFDRIAREGSRFDMAPSGAVDGFIFGRDFTMAAEFGHIPWSPTTTQYQACTPWGGPLGVRAFLDACEDGLPFRFVPDIRYPLFYVDDCYLVNPGLTRGAGHTVEQDGDWRLPFIIRHPTMDLSLAMRGLMFEYGPGASLTDPAGLFTFSRASTAYQRLRDLSWNQVAAAVLRDREHDAGVRCTLLERAGANDLVAPNDFTNAAWNKTNVTIAPDLLGAPLAGLDRIDASAGAGLHQVDQATTTAIGKIAAAACIAASNHLYACLVLYNSTDGGFARCVINLQTGAIIASTGPVRVTAAAPDVWLVEIGGTQTVPNSSIVLQMTDAAGADTWTAAGTEKIYAGLMLVEEAGWPSSYAATTRAEELLQRAHPHVPQASWWYADFIERGNIHATNAPGVLGINNSGNPSVWLYWGGSGYGIAHRRASDVASVIAGATPVVGDRVRLLGRLFADGSVKIHQTINGGAEVTAAQSSALALASAWPAGLIMGGRFSGQVGQIGLIQAKGGCGTDVNTVALAAAS